MKLKIIILLLLLFEINSLSSQEKKNSFKISGIAAHYIGNETYGKVDYHPGYYSFPIDIGIEVNYFRHLPFSINIGTGLSYQKGRVASHVSGFRRFQFYEISIPLLLQKGYSLNQKSYLFFTTGVYFGRMNLQGVQSPTSGGTWKEFGILEHLEGYSDDNHFLDISLDAGYSCKLKKWSEISFSPFLKYRINTIWLNTHQERLHYGVKLIYSFNF